MAAKYTTVLAALLAVLSSGTRRRPEYIRQKALVSLLYPYYFSEEVVGVASFSGGSLVEVIKNYDLGIDDLIGEALLGGGALESIVKEYSKTELVFGGAIFSGGVLQSSVYVNPPDTIIGSAIFSGVTTQSFPYTNWVPEQINGAAVFAGGTMG